MNKVRILIRIVSITIVTIFLTICIAAGIFLLMYHFAPEKLFECYDFGQDLYAAVRYYCWTAPPSGNWIKCNKVKYVRRYLRKEKVQKIAFCYLGAYDENMPDTWKGYEIVEPERIKQTLQLISSAKKDINAANLWLGRMVIITDKHKFIIPVERGSKAVYGWDWTSKELEKKLWEWSDNRKVYKYDLPSTEQVVAILLYSSEDSHPLAIFGDKKLAEKLIFEPDVGDDPNGIKGIADLYKFACLRKFGFDLKKEAGEWIPTSNKLESKNIFEGRDWLDKIIDAYEVALEQAIERKKYFPMELDSAVGRIVFMTHDGNYWKEIGIDENTVFDDYIKSEQLKAYFDELGLTKELLAEKPIQHIQ